MDLNLHYEEAQTTVERLFFTGCWNEPHTGVPVLPSTHGGTTWCGYMTDRCSSLLWENSLSCTWLATLSRIIKVSLCLKKKTLLFWNEWIYELVGVSMIVSQNSSHQCGLEPQHWVMEGFFCVPALSLLNAPAQPFYINTTVMCAGQHPFYCFELLSQMHENQSFKNFFFFFTK